MSGKNERRWDSAKCKLWHHFDSAMNRCQKSQWSTSEIRIWNCESVFNYFSNGTPDKTQKIFVSWATGACFSSYHLIHVINAVCWTILAWMSCRATILLELIFQCTQQAVHCCSPNFLRADQGSKNLEYLTNFHNENLVTVNPDRPWQTGWHFVLKSEKILLTPQPCLNTELFLTLRMNDASCKVLIEALTRSKRAGHYGTPVSLYEAYNVNLVIVESTDICPKTIVRVWKKKDLPSWSGGIHAVV